MTDEEYHHYIAGRIEELGFNYVLSVWRYWRMLEVRGISRSAILKATNWTASTLSHLLNMTYAKPQWSMLDQLDSAIHELSKGEDDG